MSLAEVYCSVSENFHIVWTSETGELDVEVTPACGRVKAHGTAVLPTPRSLEGWPDFEKNGRGAGFQMCRLETISTPGQRKVRVLTVPLKGSGYSSRCKCTWCNLTDSHPINQIYVMRQLCQVGLRRKMELEGVNMLDLGSIPRAGALHFQPYLRRRPTEQAPLDCSRTD